VTAVLDIRNVSFAYPAGAPVLSDASLSLVAGEICGILGPNGAGKSTLARLAAGVFQPGSGSVRVAGRDLATTEGRDRAEVVRVAFQTPEHELFRPTFGEELDWESALLGLDRQAARSRAERWLSGCNANLRLDAHPYDVDPWQRKLFSCISALSVPRRLVILDEPTLRLGQDVRGRLGTVLKAYAAEGGAIMFVTHDHEFAASICHSLGIVKGGRIATFGAVSNVLATAAGIAATNIYSFPSYYLDRAVRRRSKVPAETAKSG
jgi:energy-coupling factor transporter ATP-binding protein EcfA2